MAKVRELFWRAFSHLCCLLSLAMILVTMFGHDTSNNDKKKKMGIKFHSSVIIQVPTNLSTTKPKLLNYSRKWHESAFIYFFLSLYADVLHSRADNLLVMDQALRSAEEIDC